MKKTIISIALTFLLGPGAGHIYLGNIKKGIAMLAAVFAAGGMFFVQALNASGKPFTPDTNAALILQDFYASHPRTVLYYDIFFAAIWAYAFVDAFFKSWPFGSDKSQTV